MSHVGEKQLSKQRVEIKRLVGKVSKQLQKGELNLKLVNYLTRLANLDQSTPVYFINLGVVHYQLGNYARATECYYKALDIDENNFVAYNNLANALMKQKRHSEARYIIEKGLKINPENVDVLFNMALVLYQNNEYERSIEYFIKVLRYQQDNLEVLHQIANCYLYLEKEHLAKKYLQKALQIKPDDVYASYYLSIIAGKPAPEYATQFAEIYFANLAEGYDWSYMYRYNYKVPDGVVRILQEQYSDSAQRFNSVLDLGCGTGLMGEKLAQTFKLAKLVGIDVSQPMLAQAKAKKVYTQLECYDVTQGLKALQQLNYDLITAVGFLGYVPDLTTALREMANMLSDDAIAVFDLTFHNDDQNLKINLSTEVSYKLSYAEHCISQAGLAIVHQEKVISKIVQNVPEESPVFIVRKC